MTSGSIGPHRAFMGVSSVVCVCLGLTLLVGWRWYFETLADRQILIEEAKRAETRAKELEMLGLTPSISKVENAQVAAAQTTAVKGTAAILRLDASDSAYPAESHVKSLPLGESSVEVTDAIALLDRYWKTEGWRDRVPMVADAGRVAPLMQDFYEKQNATDPAPGGLVGKARYQIDGTEILYFSYTSSRPTGFLEVAMVRGPDGKFLIDWESLTGYGGMSFTDFRAQRLTKPVKLRAYVRLFEYYNFEFNDSKKYLCVKMTAENGSNSIYAYCLRDSGLGRWIEADLATTGPSDFKGYTMLVSFPPNAKSSQCVNLDKVVASRWLGAH